MNSKTKEMFEAELAAAREALEKSGRNTESFDVAETSHDFDLPYSTLPKIHGRKWYRTEFFAY